MSESYYHSRRNDRSEVKREEHPSIHHVVNVGVPSHSKSSPYNFNDVKHSLPRVSDGPYSHHSGHTQHHHSGSTLPPIHSGNSESRIAHASNVYHSTHSSTPRSHRDDTYHKHKPSYNYPQTSHGVFTALYPSRSGDLVTVSTSSSPLGIVRSSELPDDGDYDPKKKHKCLECGKRFDRPSGLDQHRLRHTGERPYSCPVPGCNSTFTVRSNMTRHVRTQHNCEPGDASRHDPYSAMPPRRSSDRSTGPIPISIRYC